MKFKIMKQFKFSGISVLSLEVIHILATPIILSMFKSLNKMSLMTFAYMFVATGAAMVFIGWLQYYISKQPTINNIYLTIIKISTLFVFLSGIGAIVAMKNNPFAYIILVVALWEIIQVNNYRKINTNEVIA